MSQGLFKSALNIEKPSQNKSKISFDIPSIVFFRIYFLKFSPNSKKLPNNFFKLELVQETFP